jgi:hypothetical protein
MLVCGSADHSYTHPKYSTQISYILQLRCKPAGYATAKNIDLGIQKRNSIFHETREMMRHFKAVYICVLQTAGSCLR